eukprot:81212-Ditylum_brightwellii.AAC.1
MDFKDFFCNNSKFDIQRQPSLTGNCPQTLHSCQCTTKRNNLKYWNKTWKCKGLKYHMPPPNRQTSNMCKSSESKLQSTGSAQQVIKCDPNKKKTLQT